MNVTDTNSGGTNAATASRVLCISLTSAGHRHAALLPYRGSHGDLVETIRSEWSEVDAFVLFCATGIAVRSIASLLATKSIDPAVVCVDESGRWVVPLIGGHHGANTLAREVAALLGATAVITTATDSSGVVSLDTLPGFAVRGDVAGVTRAMLDGESVSIHNPLNWPVPPELLTAAGSSPLTKAPEVAPTATSNLAEAAEGTPVRIVVSDSYRAEDVQAERTVTLVPRSLVVGIGSSSGAPVDEINDLLVRALRDASLDIGAITALATVDLKAHEPGIVELAIRLGVAMVTFPASVLNDVDVPNPSAAVSAAVGTGSVAEAAALHAAGPKSTLVVTKQRSTMSTVAIARRAKPAGELRVVGLGPGSALHRTPAASAAVRSADVVIGYSPYVDQCADLLDARHDVRRRPIGAEELRCREALECAADGACVTLVCSGDAGVYAMASLVFELAPEYGWPPIEVVPGVTAALAAAAVLGAPLGHDHASISLSDLMTPWTVIEDRVHAAAIGDFVVTFYNPRSLKRTHQLETALAILRQHRPPTTPIAAVTDVGRSTQRVVRSTLAEFDPTIVDMLTCVVVGSSNSVWSSERFVTPRGYRSPC